ncbi:kinase-like domain-containing protein [Xylogone sp. PMI_703]|nr:kinase-like domain-containing protein [Xylogone sp. PMI_703]
MSSFRIEFGDSSNTSFEGGTSYDDDSDQETEELSRSDSGGNGRNNAVTLARTGESNAQSHRHASLFYVSLIEYQCRVQAIELVNKARRPADHVDEDHPEVQELALHLFSEMSRELSRAGVLPTSEFASAELSGLRASYLSSFKSTLNNIASRRNRQIPNEIDIGPLTLSNRPPRASAYSQQASLFAMPRRTQELFNTGRLPLLTSSSSNLRAIVDSRAFKHEYEKIRCIGKGGFGQVFECRNHIDKQLYAIKQIVLSRHKTGKAMSPEKVHALLSEAQILARLDHPNIVRYYHTWAEESDLWGSIPVITVDDETSCVVEFTDSLDEGENTDGQSKKPVESTSARPTDVQNVTTTIRSQEDNSNAYKSNGKGKFWASSTLSDTDSEESQSKSKSSGASFGDIVLFIKMALYPLTLDRYLSFEDPKPGELRHCFHIPSAVGILSGILDGVEYLHSQRIIHRDLKPANIFLSITPDRRPAGDGSFNIRKCLECSHKGGQRKLFLTPCIGDFGLIAEIKEPETSESDPSSSTPEEYQLSRLTLQSPTAVGTQFYRPAKMPVDQPIICPKLDVFSLGVIAFELLYKFNTRSERVRVLDDLSRRLVLPDDFDKQQMSLGILSMINQDRDARWDTQRVRAWLDELRSG